MTPELDPKLLDFIEFSDDAGELKRHGTIVDTIGEDALVELSDVQGLPVAFVVRSLHDLSKIVDYASYAPQQTFHPDQGVHFENAILLLQNGLIVIAKDELGKVFAIEPRFRGTLLQMVNSLGERRKFDAAIVLYKLLLELSPDYSFARENLAITFLNRGALHGQDGQLVAAAEDFNRALMLNPSSDTVSKILKNLVASYTQLGVSHSQAKDYERAYRWFQISLELDPSDISRQNLAVAFIAMTTERTAGSTSPEQIFELPRLMGLSSSSCWTAYGATVAAIGKLGEARRAFLAALEADPENAIARHNLEVLSTGIPNQTFPSGLVSKKIEPISFFR